jgi:16S rRNA processing protein RimM
MAIPANSGIGELERVILGKVTGIYGVSGWIKVLSYTRPRQNIFSYTPWQVGQKDNWETWELEQSQVHGKGLIAKLKGLDDRELAGTRIGQDIAVNRNQLPDLPDGEYYWCDLIQMEVVNQNGENLGRVTEIKETGANDVLVVTGNTRHLIPLIFDQYIINVDQDLARIMVDWDPRT